MAIASKVELSAYCLRKLGQPVINVNVAIEQIEDRIDEAIQIWQEKHFDATEKLWMAYAVTEADINNKYITLPKNIHIVDKILPASIFSRSNGDGVFGFQYQFMKQHLSPFQPIDTLNYSMTMMQLNDVNDTIHANERFEFTKHMNKLNIYSGMSGMNANDIMCIHVYQYIAESSDMWNDKWLKQYTTALIKQQWGQNMIKHEGIQLLGGVTISGQVLYEQATTEIEKLEEQLQETYHEPVGFFIG